MTAIEPHPTIRTSNEYPPIPVRTHDWVAFCDGWEETGLVGNGATEEAAVNSLQDLLEDHGYVVRRIDDATYGALALIDAYRKSRWPTPVIVDKHMTGMGEVIRQRAIQDLRSHLILKAVAYPNEDSGRASHG